MCPNLFGGSKAAKQTTPEYVPPAQTATFVGENMAQVKTGATNKKKKNISSGVSAARGFVAQRQSASAGLGL